MPLSKPAPRDHHHTRSIISKGYQREDGLWDLEAEMIDTKTYSIENMDHEGISAGEPIHHMHVRLTVDEKLIVEAIEVVTDRSPFSSCSAITPAYKSLVGLTVGRGWRKNVFAKLGRTAGCTHLTDLLVGPLPVLAYQTIRTKHKNRSVDQESENTKPGILDTCHALASDSPVVKREWPEFYTGD